MEASALLCLLSMAVIEDDGKSLETSTRREPATVGSRMFFYISHTFCLADVSASFNDQSVPAILA